MFRRNDWKRCSGRIGNGTAKVLETLLRGDWNGCRRKVVAGAAVGLEKECLTKYDRIMVEFEIKERTQPVGRRRGQKVYYAQPKGQQRLSNQMLVDRIVRGTSLSEGDVKSALVSLSAVVCEALELGMSVDLAELGRLRVIFPSRMMDSRAEVTVGGALKSPKVLFTPKRAMLRAAKAVSVSIDHTEG